MKLLAHICEPTVHLIDFRALINGLDDYVLRFITIELHRRILCISNLGTQFNLSP